MDALRLSANNKTPCIFDDIVLKAQKFFPLEIIYTIALGNSFARENTSLTEHIKKVSNIPYIKLISCLDTFLMENKNDFIVIAKKATLGSYKKLKAILLCEKLKETLINKEDTKKILKL